MSYIQNTMADNEKIEKLFDLHWINYIKGYLFVGVAIPIVATMFNFLDKSFMSLHFLIAIIIVFAAVAPFFLSLKSVEQGVTNRKLVYKKGLVSRETSEIILDAIQTVEMDQSFMGRMLNFGDIKVIGRGTGEIVFKDISHPIEVKKAIENMIEKYN